MQILTNLNHGTENIDDKKPKYFKHNTINIYIFIFQFNDLSHTIGLRGVSSVDRNLHAMTIFTT